MSRGRQKRVEKAQERRQESKKTKVRKEIRSTYKTLVRDQLFPLLNKINFNVSTIDIKTKDRKEAQTYHMHVLHVWVDTLPSSRESNRGDALHEDIDEEDISKKGKKKKSNGGTASPALKKSHPRTSAENAGDTSCAASENDEPLLCRSYFFTGQCPGLKGAKSKKSGQICPYTHHPSKQLKLVDAIKKSQKSEKNSPSDEHVSTVADVVLKRASHAAAISQINLDNTAGNSGLDVDKVDSIEMLYYMEIPITLTTGGGTSSTRTGGVELNVSEILSKIMVSEKVPISGIAYVAYCNVLLFDRFDGGKVLDKETEMKLCADEQGQSDAEINEGGSDQKRDNIINLSGPILELILRYLPDVYSGILRLTCTTFCNEIGTHSPALWKFLLARNNWPDVDNVDNATAKDLTTAFKDLYISHYTACHRVESFANGMCEVLRPDVDHTKSNNNTKDSTAIKLNHCSSGYDHVAFWDESCVLLTSKNDCVLNLVHVSEQHSKHVCKQTLEVRVAPVPISKKCPCQLDSFAIDDRYIVCSYTVDGSSVLTCMLKDNLLTNSMEESIMGGEILATHDLSSSFKEFLDGPGQDHYISFPNRDGHWEYDVSIDGDIHACGNGVFCAIVEIHHDVIEVEEFVFGILTFSASRGRKFVLDYIQLPHAIDNNNPLLCTNFHRKKKIEPTEVVYKDWRTAALYLVVVDRSGTFQEKSHRLLYEGWDVTDHLEFKESLFLGNDDQSKESVKTLNGRTHVATSYLLSLSVRPESCDKRVMIMMQGKDFESLPTTILLRDSYSKILWMKFIGEDHLVICAYCSRRETSQSAEEINVPTLVVVHIPIMTEIYCSGIQSPKLPGIGDDTIPIIADVSKKGAMTAVVGGMDLCITGAMTNYQAEEKAPKLRKVKTKKRLAKTGNKRLGTGLQKL